MPMKRCSALGRPLRIPAEGEQCGKLVVVSVGESTALCVCECGRHVRYRLEDVRRYRACRTCRKPSSLHRNNRRPGEIQYATLTIRVPPSYLPRLERASQRLGRSADETLTIAVERLLYACGV